MLKPGDPVPPSGERPIGEIFSDLVDEGKAFARAEIDVAKAFATAKTSALKTPLILLVVAMFVAMAALNLLAITIFVMLALVMNAALAGILAFLIVAGAAGLFAWLGVRKLKDL